MHASTWAASPALDVVLGRIHALLPENMPARSGVVQSHVLHLASDGFIEPHIDNVGASGSWILGVSLGAQRDMLLESVERQPYKRFQISLPSGSVYLQRCESSRDEDCQTDGIRVASSQRLGAVQLSPQYLAGQGPARQPHDTGAYNCRISSIRVNLWQDFPKGEQPSTT